MMTMKASKVAMAAGVCAVAATLVAWAQDPKNDRAPHGVRRPIAGTVESEEGLLSLAGTEPAFPRLLDYLTPLPEQKGVIRFVAQADDGEAVGVESAGAVAGEAETRLVYSNTEGRSLFGPSTGGRVADDILTTVMDGCALDRYVVRVVGNRTNSASETRAFSVVTRLHPVCPGATPTGASTQNIVGTRCAFDQVCVEGKNRGRSCLSNEDCGEGGSCEDLPVTGASEPLELVCKIPPGSTISLPKSFFVSADFDRDNAGLVVGGTALTGFTADRADVAGAACAASFGGFPDRPHASFYTEVYVRGDCPNEVTTAYRNSLHAEAPFSAGANVPFAEVIDMDTGGEDPRGCNLIGYEVTVKGSSSLVNGNVVVEIRTALDANIDFGRCVNDSVCSVDAQNCADGSTCLQQSTLRGSRASLPVLPPFANRPQVFSRFFRRCVGGSNDGRECLTSAQCEGGSCELAPAEVLERRVFAVFTTSIGQIGPILTREQADWGATPNEICVFRTNPNRWDCSNEQVSFGHAGLDVTLFCAGPPPPGACCDMALTVNRACVGGPRDGKSCSVRQDCVCPANGFVCDGGKRQGESCDPTAGDPDDPFIGCPTGADCVGCTFLPGVCVGDSVCRNIPKINCASLAFRPELWQEGEQCRGTCSNNNEPCTAEADCPLGTCEGGPFPLPCGQGACCKAEPEGCENVTERACNEFPPEDKNARQFRRGEVCGEGAECPRGACLARSGSCFEEHTSICEFGGLKDQFCIPEEARFFCGGICMGGTPLGLSCTRSEDCPNNNICDLQTGECTEEFLECEDDNQCLRQSACLAGRCERTCIFDSDCAGAGICALQSCVGGSRNGQPCRDNNDCPSEGQFTATCSRSVCPQQPGCDSPSCCSQVCQQDPVCCSQNWDVQCATRARQICDAPPPPWDVCSSNDPDEPEDGAKRVFPNDPAELVDFAEATADPADPPFCCKTDGAGQTGHGTLWFKFVAPQNGQVGLDTCSQSVTATDSILQVFAVGDPDKGLCPDDSECSVAAQDCEDGGECRFTCNDNLSPIGCSDDAGPSLCPDRPKNASLCLTGLTPGQTYFIQVSAKEDFLCLGGRRNRLACDPTRVPDEPNADCPGRCEGGSAQGNDCLRNTDCPAGNCEDNGEVCTNDGQCSTGTCVPARCINTGVCLDQATTETYDLRLISPCTSTGNPPLANDVCVDAQQLGQASHVIPFDLSGGTTNAPASFDCPGPPESCAEGFGPEIWYDWTSPLNGEATIEACGDDDEPVNLVVFKGCDCPAEFDSATTLCPDPENPPTGCEQGGRFTFGVQAGECVKIAISGVDGSFPKGTLNISTRGCPQATLAFLDPRDLTLDARQPWPPDDPAELQGIREFLVESSVTGVDILGCWQLCETASFDSGSAVPPELRFNAIESVELVDPSPLQYLVTLIRPITPNALTTLTFRRETDALSPAQFFSFPGDVNLDGVVNENDVAALIDMIENGTPPPQPGPFQTDIAHSGNAQPRPQALTALLDLINGGQPLPLQKDRPFPPFECILED